MPGDAEEGTKVEMLLIPLILIGMGHRHGVAGRGLGASGKTQASPTDEKSSQGLFYSVVELHVRWRPHKAMARLTK